MFGFFVYSVSCDGMMLVVAVCGYCLYSGLVLRLPDWLWIVFCVAVRLWFLVVRC